MEVRSTSFGPRPLLKLPHAHVFTDGVDVAGEFFATRNIQRLDTRPVTQVGATTRTVKGVRNRPLLLAGQVLMWLSLLGAVVLFVMMGRSGIAEAVLVVPLVFCGPPALVGLLMQGAAHEVKVDKAPDVQKFVLELHLKDGYTTDLYATEDRALADRVHEEVSFILKRKQRRDVPLPMEG